MKKLTFLILCTLLSNATTFTNNPQLFQEARTGDKEAIKQRLENGQDCTAQDEDGNTILHIAAQEGHEEIIDIITEYFNQCSYWTYYTSTTKIPSLDDVNNNGDTALHAVINGKENDTNDEKRAQVAEYLLKKHPQLMEKCNKKNLSPVFTAIQKDKPRFIRLLAAHTLDLSKYTRDGETMFTYAIKEKKPESITYCAQKTSLGNVANNDDKTPTLLAIDTENIQILELLTEHLNTFVAHRDIKPIHYAASNGKYKVVEYILSKNVSVNEPDKDGNPPLFHAIDNNDEDMLNHLLSRGADLKKRNTQGEDALSIATYNKHFHLIDVLTTHHKVDINARDNKGRTSLMRSSIEQNHEVMQALLDRGANIRITDNMRENILHKMARTGDQKGARIALKYDKLLVNDTNKDGNTPILTAVQNGQFIFAQLLLDAGSPVESSNEKGETILHEAVKHNNKLFLAELYKKVTPHLINKKNNNGESALFFAVRNNDVTTIKNLITLNAECRTITNIQGLAPLHCAAAADAVAAMQELEHHGVLLTDCTASGNTAAHIAAAHGKIKSLRYLQSKDGVCEIYNHTGENPFSYGALQGQLEATKILLREEYFINDTVSRTITSLKNAPAHHNERVLTFLTHEHNERIKKCQEIYNLYVQTNNLISENKRSIAFLGENNFLRFFTYASSQLDRTTVHELYHMTENQRIKLANHYWKSKDTELTHKINFEKEITNLRLEQQNALAKQQKEKELIRTQQQDELKRIAEKNRPQRSEPERIAAQQGTTLAEQKAALETIAADKYRADIEANNKRIADEKTVARAAEEARAIERARITAENMHNSEQHNHQEHIVNIQGQPVIISLPANQAYPPQEEQATEEECCICLENATYGPLPCPHCKIGSARICITCLPTLKGTCPMCRGKLTEILQK